MGKEVTLERAETMWQRAIEGSERLGLSDVASEYEEMGLDGYIEKKGLRIVNPTIANGRKNDMANLTISDWETLAEYINGVASKPLDNGGRAADVRAALEEIADLTDPESTIIFNDDGTCEAEFENDEDEPEDE